MPENELVDQQPDPVAEECRDGRPYSKNMDGKQFEESSSLQLAGPSERGSTPTETQNSGPHDESKKTLCLYVSQLCPNSLYICFPVSGRYAFYIFLSCPNYMDNE